jgi:hypothetical protein
MGNLLHNRWRCEDLSKENNMYTGVLQFFIRKTNAISRTLRLMHDDGISFDKILPKEVGYFVTRIN